MNTRLALTAAVGFAFGDITTLVYVNALPAVFRDKQALHKAKIVCTIWPMANLNAIPRGTVMNQRSDPQSAGGNPPLLAHCLF